MSTETETGNVTSSPSLSTSTSVGPSEPSSTPQSTAIETRSSTSVGPSEPSSTPQSTAIETNRTTEYITTTISPVSDENEMEEEEEEEEEEEIKNESNINKFINDVSEFSNKVNMYRFKSLKDVFNTLKKRDDPIKYKILFNYLKDTLLANIHYIKNEFNNIKEVEKNLKNMRELKNKYQKTTHKLKEEISLDERKYEYSLSEYNKMVFETNLLKNFLIFCIFLFSVPILKLTSLINGDLSIIIYFISLFIGICIAVYSLYKNSQNRDNVFIKF